MRISDRTRDLDLHGDPAATMPASRRLPHSPHAAALVAALHACDPLRSAFDQAVRRFVRAERDLGRTLDEVLDELRATVRLHVDPALAPDRTHALRTAAQWFAVSEYHRAD